MILQKNKITSLPALTGFIFLSFILISTFTYQLNADQWFNHYEKAMKAFTEKNWNQTISNLTEAIREKQEPKINCKTWGVRFVDYLPYYYMGTSYFYLGNYEQAKFYFNKSLEYGEIKKKENLLLDLNQKLELCKTKLSPTPIETPPTEITQPETKDSSTAAQISQYIAEGDKFKSIGDFPSARKEYSKAKNLIELSKEKTNLLVDITQKLAETSKTEKLLQAEDLLKQNRFDEAITTIQTVLKDNRADTKARLLLKQAQLARDRFQKTPPQSPSTATATTPTDTGGQNSINILLVEGSQLLKQENWETAKDKFAAALQLNPNLPNALLALYTIANHYLNSGIKSYFNGDLPLAEESLDKVLDILGINPLSSQNNKTVINTYLFKAVILLEKHFLGTAAHGNEMQEARDFISKIYTLDPDFQPPKQYFSPRISYFLERTYFLERK